MYKAISMLLLTGYFSTASAAIKLPAIIGENMVLQKGIKVPLWGWAEPGEEIQVEFQGRKFKTKTDLEGKWFLRLSKYHSGGPHQMRLTSKYSDILLKNILLGDVWLASGQSNMEFGLQTERTGQEEISNAADSLIRMFYVPMSFSPEPEKAIKAVQPSARNGRWIVCSPAAMADPKWAWHGFSAVGYYFAKALRSAVKYPVGIIGSYKGGTPAQAWISLSGLQKAPAFSSHINAYESARTGATGFSTPSGLFNAMINPLIPYGIRGVIWYQGESNGDKMTQAIEYPALFPRLISDWRKQWNQGNFPFLYVQLANFRKSATSPSEGVWPWVREAQLKALSEPATAMVVTTDIGEAADIHPKNKKDVGLRLALAARKIAYQENLVYSGPVYKSLKIKGNTAVLHFAHTGSGLIGSNPLVDKQSGNSAQIEGFAIAGEDGNFMWANAVIEGDNVRVSSPKITKPVAVRYNWADNPAGALYNKEGLPATPFRTDHFPAKK